MGIMTKQPDLHDTDLPRETLLSIISQLQDGVMLVGLDGQVQFMNKFAREIYGFKKGANYKLSLEQYDDKFPMYYYNSQKRMPVSRRPSMRVIAGDSVDTVIILDTAKVGAKRHNYKVVHYRANSINGKNKKPMYILVLLRDITKQRSMIKERKELLELNKAKDEFISLSSHQLRTPATAVKQFIGMVLEGYAGQIKKSQREMLEHAYNSNERQLHVISDLLKVAQVDAGKVKLFIEKSNIVQLLTEVISEQQKQFEERSQNISFHTKQMNIQASFDVNRLRMVFENLIDNASKYTPEGKSIEVSIEQRSKGKIAVHINDEGVGIPKEDIDKLFEKFIRLDNPLSIAVGGTGLGLYWVKKIVNLHKGTISVESEPNVGTTFTVVIPQHHSASKA